MIAINVFIISNNFKVLLIILVTVFFIFNLGFLIHHNRQLKKKIIQLKILNDISLNSIARKDVQIKDIHHRIKNNLQLIISLLNLEAVNKNGFSIDDFLTKSQSQIYSIASIHQALYESEFINQVNLQEYFETIIQNLIEIHKTDIKIEINTNETILDCETAIPIGLILTELVCNAFKHAFTVTKSGHIKIDIIKNSQEKYSLTIQDNGIGFSKIPSHKTKIGLELISMLVLQINGNLHQKNKDGTVYNIIF